MAQAPLRVLTFTTLYPNAERPRHGIFVETRLVHFRRAANADVRVVAPVPWFPSGAERFGEYARFARTPREETREDIRILHPRYPTVPGIGMYTQPFALARGSAGIIRVLLDAGFDFDLIDAHYLYPDGVAAALLARRFARPLVLTARGSDVNVLMQYRLPRNMVLRAARHAGAVVAVSGALKKRLVDHGVDAARVQVLRNGVDASVFRPEPVGSARAALGVGPGPLFAAVGNLVSEKGHDLVIDAAASIDGATLLVVGEGPERQRLEAHARARGMAQRVQFLPVRPQRELATIYSAADALVLASLREGWPNVVLEAMACGAPVIATAVGGVPEIITDPRVGRVVAQRSGEALAAAMRQLLADPPARDSIVAYASRFGWDETAVALEGLFRQVVAAHARSTKHGGPVAGHGHSTGQGQA